MSENQSLLSDETHSVLTEEIKSISQSTLNSQQNEPKTRKQTVKPHNSDNKQMNKFIAPMFDDLERIVSEQMKQLDKLEDKSMDSIMKNLESLITNSNDIHNSEVDPSQRKNHELLQTKFNKSAENSNASNESEDEKKEKKNEAIDLKSIKLSNLTCLAQSLTAHLVTKNSRRGSEKLKNLTVKIYDSVNLWLSRLFRFENSSVLFHDQEPDGFVRMCQIMLNCKFNDFQTNGYQVINRQPAIYISAASKYSLPEYTELISIQLGLPVSSIRIVPISKVLDNNLDKIDISLFTKQVENDLADGFVPLILVASAGSYSIGQCDDLNQLNNIAYKYKMWIHLEGVYLSTLVLYSVPTEILHVASGDSLTINLGEWLGLPSLSYVTLYKNVKNSNLYLQPFNSVISTLQKSLPYWCVLQAIGHQGVIEKIKNATDMTYYMGEIVKKQKPYLKILDFKSINAQETHTKINSLGDLFSRALSFLTFVDLKNPIIVFKCDKAYIKERLYLYSDLTETKTSFTKNVNKGENLRDSFLKMMQEPESDLSYSKKLIGAKKIEENNNINYEQNTETNSDLKEYSDTLTTWLCDLLNSLHKNIELELIEIENDGICIRYSPLEHANIFGTSAQDIKKLDKSLEDIISILDASIKCKSMFGKEISEFKNLIPVNIPKWAGIGAVRYVPDYLIDKLDDISKYLEFLKEKEFSTSITEQLSTDSALETDNDTSKSESEHSNNTNSKFDDIFDEKIKHQMNQDIKEINEINEQLVKSLQAQDGAFSIGQAYDGLKAVKFGMVSELDALKKLAGQVQEVGKTVEEDSRFIEKMTELTRLGIEKANEDLKRENEAKLMQQGILRQIPYLNDVLKWWGTSETQTIGRSFNLQSGRMASTEVIYKYHMQVEENLKNNSDNKSPKQNENDKNNSINDSNHNDKYSTEHSSINSSQSNFDQSLKLNDNSLNNSN